MLHFYQKLGHYYLKCYTIYFPYINKSTNSDITSVAKGHSWGTKAPACEASVLPAGPRTRATKWLEFLVLEKRDFLFLVHTKVNRWHNNCWTEQPFQRDFGHKLTNVSSLLEGAIYKCHHPVIWEGGLAQNMILRDIYWK